MDSCHSLFIVSAPSGAGKTTLVKHLLMRDKNVQLSISTTTRAPREGEKNGVDYFFTSVADFKEKIAQNAFAEYAEVHGNFYGTSKEWLESALTKNDVLLEIDVQGAAQIKKVFPQAISIFILPPSLEILKERLTGRHTDSDEVIKKRLAAAFDELRTAVDFDYAIMNDHLASAADELCAVVKAARCRIENQKIRHAAFFTKI